MVRVQELLVVQHAEREGPGLLAQAARERGLAVRILRPFAGDHLPDAVRPDQILAVMGGPMGVADLGDPAFPWLAPLVTLLRRALDDGGPVLGFCLGAQLLAHAAGGSAIPLTVGDPPRPHREVGFGAISFTRSPLEEPLLQDLPASLLVLHWHGDRILLPSEATLLASSLACPEQLFRIGSRAYGLQFHIEVTPAALERWIEEDASFVQAALGVGGAERIRAEAARWLVPVTPLWRLLLQQLLQQLLYEELPQAFAQRPDASAEPTSVAGRHDLDPD
jgi:GMP synthase-like glutamine amidotransferase